MNFDVKNLFKDGMVYGIGEILTRISQFLILPLILAYLSPEQFGTADYFLSLKNFLTIILNLGMMTAILRVAAEDKGFNQSEVVFSSISITFFIGLSGLILLYFISGGLSVFLLDTDLGTDFIISFATAWAYSMRLVILGVNRLNRTPGRFIFLNLADIFIYIVLAYYLVSSPTGSYRSLLIANLISVIISLIIGFIMISKNISVNYNKTIVMELLAFGFAFLFINIVFSFLQISNRIFLKFDSSFSDLGLLGLTTRLSLLVGSFVITPFSLAWLPFLNQSYKKNNFRETINRVYTLYIGFVLLICILIQFTVADILILFNLNEYKDIDSFISYYTVGYLFFGLYYFFSGGIYIKNEKIKYTLIGIFVLLFNLVASLIMKGDNTLHSVSLISLISYILLAVFSWNYSKDIISVKLFSSDVLWFIGVTLGFIVLFFITSKITILNEPGMAYCTKYGLLGLFTFFILFKIIKIWRSI
ncbi:MAG: oligosaccharide flippase family protein [Bacteroidetes bacterium]|nr:oligosaccharide flippase family protein [Bacteroidota bacterium]